MKYIARQTIKETVGRELLDAYKLIQHVEDSDCCKKLETGIRSLYAEAEK
ncbi:MAG: hypothetical protein PHT07_11040 [Paludibacter sp.]|nr:hypothetical protein [Paludibacter sp.]